MVLYGSTCCNATSLRHCHQPPPTGQPGYSDPPGCAQRATSPLNKSRVYPSVWPGVLTNPRAKESKGNAKWLTTDETCSRFFQHTLRKFLRTLLQGSFNEQTACCRRCHHESDRHPEPFLYCISPNAAGHKHRQGINISPNPQSPPKSPHTFRSKPLFVARSGSMDKNVHPGMFPMSTPVLLGFLFQSALLLRLGRIDISRHYLSVFVDALGINSVYPAL